MLHHALRLQTPVSTLPKTLHTLPTPDTQTSTLGQRSALKVDRMQQLTAHQPLHPACVA